ncbi:MAG: tRNA (adenosine(37)-N6)-threonylcarbamoyltransferase complex transferase subunit TsaD [Candidatus Omnitrophica bacterium]|nr:tRNA (adenosine(37)-N6)-threonylcarbamoyltransferase complex transferase subunit TsaD [Candidatus Omnitrophota bacterium]
MITLGIETSCDETAAAVMCGAAIRASTVSSSVHRHEQFGGIIPEIASRYHLSFIVGVTKTALEQAGTTLSQIDLIAVTQRPGLLGSLLVGVSFAKALSYALRKPLIAVNHIKAHLFSPFLACRRMPFPFIGLVVSGGHTSLALVRDFDRIRFLGKTRDDAAGESFDKVAKMLGLPYPGGPVIDRLAQTVASSPFNFHCAPLKDSFDFSFSGIKTQVLYTLQALPNISAPVQTEISYAFQKAVVDSLVEKSIGACRRYKVRRLAVGGGVACNSALRRRLQERCAGEKINLHLPPAAYCVDNAAMIAFLGYHLFRRGKRADLYLNALPTGESGND